MLKADNFLPIAEAYRIKGKTIEKCAGEFAACDCHIDMWVKGRSRKRRLKRMQDSVGFESCCWEGRRLPWFISEGKSRLIKELKDASSDLLQNLLAALPADRRSELVAAMDVLSQDLVETLEEPYQ